MALWPGGRGQCPHEKIFSDDFYGCQNFLDLCLCRMRKTALSETSSYCRILSRNFHCRHFVASRDEADVLSTAVYFAYYSYSCQKGVSTILEGQDSERFLLALLAYSKPTFN